MSKEVVFQQKPILTYLLKKQGNVDKLRAFIRQFQENEAKFGGQITNSYTQKTQNEAFIKYEDKKIKQMILELGVLNKEKEHHQENAQFLKGKVSPWLQDLKKMFAELKDQLKKLDSKKLNKILKQEDVSKYKQHMIASITQIEQRQLVILQALSKHLLKNNCELLENITNIMQKELKVLKSQVIGKK